MAPTASLILVLVLTAAAGMCGRGTAGDVSFDVHNTASGTAGGRRFDMEVAAAYARTVLTEGSSTVWEIFHQRTSAARKPVGAVSLVVVDDNKDGQPAATVGSEIRLSAESMAGYRGNVKKMVTGVLYHELTHVWQWTGQGHANARLLEGIADLVQVRSGNAPTGWAKAGEGSRWDEQRPGVTAMFLDHLDNLRPGFIAQLNAAMKTRYDGNVFTHILGKPVEQLWQDYKAAYAAA